MKTITICTVNRLRTHAKSVDITHTLLYEWFKNQQMVLFTIPLIHVTIIRSSETRRVCEMFYCIRKAVIMSV